MSLIEFHSLDYVSRVEQLRDHQFTYRLNLSKREEQRYIYQSRIKGDFIELRILAARTICRVFSTPKRARTRHGNIDSS